MATRGAVGRVHQAVVIGIGAILAAIGIGIGPAAFDDVVDAVAVAVEVTTVVSAIAVGVWHSERMTAEAALERVRQAIAAEVDEVIRDAIAIRVDATGFDDVGNA